MGPDTIDKHWTREEQLKRLLVGALLLFALLLRLRGVVAFPLEGDEIYTYFEARDLFATQLKPGIEGRPLYYLLQHAVFGLGPDRHPALLRLLPLVFGVSGVWATWKLGREISGTVAGMTGATVTALSPWHLYVSGMARYWSLVYLLACVSYWRLLVAARTDARRDYLFAFAAISAGALTHPTFLFPIAGFAAAYSMRRSASGWQWRWPSRNALTYLWFPLCGLILAGFVALVLTGNSGAVRNWGGRSLISIARLVPAMVQWMTPVVGVAGLVGITVAVFSSSTTGPEKQWGVFALAGILASTGLLVSASFLTDVYADYGIAALPLFAASIGLLFEIGARKFRNGGTSAALIGLILLAAAMAPSTGSHLSDGTRFDYRPAFEHVRDSDPTSPVYLEPVVQLHWYADYLVGEELNPGSPPPTIEDGAWVVIGVRRYGIPGDHGESLRRWLTRRCVLQDSWEGLRFDYRRYRVELHRCGAVADG